MVDRDDGYLVKPELFYAKMNILVYGDPGAGKTHLAATAQDVPEMANVHFFNIDGGLMTVASRGDIRATDIRSVDKLEDEFHRVINRDPKYDGTRTIVIDNISELQTLCLENAVRAEYKERKQKDKNYTIDDIYIDDYGKSGRQLARILRGFRDLPLHVIYVAHKKDKIRKGTTILESSKPNVTDKLCTAIQGYMDFVWYLYTADEQVTGDDGSIIDTRVVRYMLTQPANQYAAKTRGSEFSQRLGLVVRDPSMPLIMDEFKKAQEVTNNG